ncbi:hypothetical protein [Novacetimonas pomaceti]|uniref:hypothetical protein n=1 Tax=Novacetimonas pomaceti TaxID=2021998 RepID=UPI001C2DEC0B|nr:hypothetical protein [Novacetimonas pomaceti]MBV1832598.1 hypothetical protein [Novacetimonas pomaceti]
MPRGYPLRLVPACDPLPTRRGWMARVPLMTTRFFMIVLPDATTGSCGSVPAVLAGFTLNA